MPSSSIAINASGKGSLTQRARSPRGCSMHHGVLLAVPRLIEQKATSNVFIG